MSLNLHHLHQAVQEFCKCQGDFFELELYAAKMQGKGWGGETMQQEVESCLSLLNRPPNVLIDIGGNKGIYTETLLRRFPGTPCHIFEPASTNIEILNNKFGDTPNVTVNANALSKQKGSFTLYSNNPGSGLASLTKRNIAHFNKYMDLEETVDVIRFDQYWEGDDIDYVKIDVEGHELDVLDGFGKLLNKTRLIQFEFGGCNIDTKTHYRDFWYYFTDRSFSLYRITPSGPHRLGRYNEYDEYYMATNFIAVNQNMM